MTPLHLKSKFRKLVWKPLEEARSSHNPSNLSIPIDQVLAWPSAAVVTLILTVLKIMANSFIKWPSIFIFRFGNFFLNTEITLYFQCILKHMMLVCLCMGNINLDHLVKVIYPQLLYYKFIMFAFLIYSLCHRCWQNMDVE